MLKFEYLFLLNGGDNLYKRIKFLREDKNLNQTQIAKILNMSQTGYNQYEIGKNDIPTKVLIQLAKYYNVTTDYILELKDDIN